MNDISINLSRVANALPEVLQRRIDTACNIIERDAKVNCPKDDGTLRASITHQTEIEEGVIRGVVGTNVEYAPYVHEGTGIYAKDGNGRQNVPWVYKDGHGKFHTTKGQKPNEFLRKAFDADTQQVIDCLEGALDDTL